MKKALLLAGAIVAAVPAWAEWTWAFSTGTTEFYVDIATLRSNGAMHRIWSVSDYKAPSKHGDRSSKSLYQIDCEEERYRSLQVTFYTGQMARGEASTFLNSPGEWRYIAPSTFMDRIKSELCSER